MSTSAVEEGEAVAEGRRRRLAAEVLEVGVAQRDRAVEVVPGDEDASC